MNNQMVIKYNTIYKAIGANIAEIKKNFYLNIEKDKLGIEEIV